jgi:hypothetical protein
MAENMIKFLRGNVASLPQTATPGAVYFTKDEGLYLGLADGTYHRYGDFIEVANVDSLPADGAHIKAMYYCTAENILAKWNGSKWVQINKQQTLAELGGVAKSVYEAKIAALEKADTDNATAIDTLSKYVGTIPEGSTATNVVAYVQEKTSGIASEAAMTELSNRVTTVEGDVATIKGDYLKSTDKTALEGQISAVQTAVDNEKTRAEGIEGGLRTDVDAIKADYLKAADKTALQDNIDAVAEDVAEISKDYLTSDDKTALESKMATDIAAAVKTETDNRVLADQAIEAKIGEVAEGKTVVKMIEEAQAAASYDDTALVGRVSAVEGKVSTIEGDYLKAADKTELQGNIDAVAREVAGITTDYLDSADKVELEDKINAKVAQTAYDTKMAEIKGTTDSLQTQINTIMNNPDAEGAINSINEFTQYVADHGTIADGFRADIDKNKADIAAEVKRAGEAESALSGRLDTLEAIDHDAYVAADTALKNELNGEIAKKADKTALEAAVETLEGADTAIKGRLDVLEGKFTGEGSVESQITTAKQEAIDTAAGDATTKANKALEDAKKYADAEDAKIEARLDALELIDHDHANKAELDLIASGDKAKWDAAAAKAHEHANSAELAKIADGDVAKWNGAQAAAEATASAALATAKSELEGKISAAETAAKDHADAEVGKVQTALDNYKESNNTAVAGKADKATTLAGYGIADAMTADQINALLTWGEF